jgi:hypothetical protein
VEIDPFNDIQMVGFKRLSEVDRSVPEPKSDDEITLFSRLDEVGFFVDMVEEEEPKGYWEAVNGPNGKWWKEAVDKELDSLDRARTWDVVDKVEGGKEVGSKWVFKVKRLLDGSINKFKARLVAQGFTQRPGFDFDKTYASVVHFDSLQFLLAIMAVQGCRLHQVDIKSAFLYGDLAEEIYMTLPEGRREKVKTTRLRKCIYGLKQSGRKWYERLTQHFVSYGFVTSNFDPCVLTHKTEVFFIAIYVDAITLYGPGGPMITDVKNTLKSKFEVTDLGDLHWLLGIQIKFGSKGIELSQTAYINSILSRFGLQDCNSTILPIDQGTTLTRSNPEDVLKDIKTYQSIIGPIMYLVTGTQPDLTFAISFLAQFFSAPNKQHIAVVKCCLQYIKGTRHLTLLFPYGGKMFIARFSDTNYDNCIDSRQSVSGY